ncbi:MAG: hypothetical protein ACRC6B_03905 [Fusobacteriaceae bacterium]
MVSLRFEFNGINIRVYSYNHTNGNMVLALDLNGTGADEVTEEISLSLGEDRFLQTLENNYGIKIEIAEGYSYSHEATAKAQALSYAGFTKLIRQDNDFTVDGVFAQNFLSQEELDQLLNDNIEELLLSEIS